MSRAKRFQTGIGVVAVLALAAQSFGGPLFPPVGPVQSTNRQTINAQSIGALPFVISQSGSYVVVSNLTGAAGVDLIQIDADNVTLDLNGFSLRGAAGSLNGIRVLNTHRNITIVNGSLQSFGANGVDVQNASSVVLRGLNVSDCSSVGIQTNFNAVLSDCTLFGNGLGGMATGNNCTIQQCAAVTNFGSGFMVGFNSALSGCVSDSNIGDGFATASGCSITASIARANTGIGMRLDNACKVTDSVCDLNGETGIFGFNHITITGTNSIANGIHGIEAFDHPHVSGCNVSFNSQNGIYTNDGTITNCSAFNNGGNGIEVFFYDAHISNCNASQNDSDGVRVVARCQVINNTCNSNLGAGVNAAGERNRIDGNHVADNARGIEAAAPGLVNFIVRNSAIGNGSNYGSIDPANDVGPIGSAAGSTSPWANLAF